MHTDTLTSILSRNLCSGCGLCEALGASSGIRMAFDRKGFLRPDIKGGIPADLDRTIGAVCPGANIDMPIPEDEQTVLWGPIRSAWTGHATDDPLRFVASSGGALSAMLIHLLQSGQADTIVQVKAATDRPTENALTLSRSSAEVMAAAGSRYAPSAPLADIIDLLRSGERIVFVGKPCDVAGLTNLLDAQPDLGTNLVAKISFMCGGVPSQHGTDRIIERLGLAGDSISEFRYRGEGWPGGVRAVTATGKTGTMSYHDSWGGILSGMVQFRCKVCPDGTGAFADLVFADAWHGDARGYPSFDEADGRSMILARTALGEALLDGARAANTLKAAPLDIDEIAAMQPFQANRKRLVLARLAAMTATLQRRPRYQGLRLEEAARQAPLKLRLRNFLGLLRRFLKGTAG